MALIESQNLTLQEAARKAGITVPSLRSAIHGDPGRLTVKTVAALCRNLGLPLELVAPAIPA
jgi:transcriptional regulator with XRE-family HTH domain